MAVYRRLNPQGLKAWGEKWNLPLSDMTENDLGFEGYWAVDRGPDGSWLMSVTGEPIRQYHKWPSPETWTEFKDLYK
jgi:hypothetical protein